MIRSVRVTSASEAAARDAATIAAGVPSRALMERAGAAAATEIARRFADRLGGGVRIYAGPGNNGGDAWVVARSLVGEGVRVRVIESGEARTGDAAFERKLALPLVSDAAHDDAAALVIDGLLGTGSSGTPRGRVAELISEIVAARAGGLPVASLDVPSGLDATTGEMREPCVTADVTLTFGTLKRGLLRARDVTGTIVVLDIGLHDDPADRSTPILVHEPVVSRALPRIGAAAHKGTRRKIAVLGGAHGMAGAIVLASRAALRSGVGMVRALVAPESVLAIQTGVPEALAGEWPDGEGAEETLRELVSEWADAILLGPGLGRGRRARPLLETTLRVWGGPVVLDADALNAFAGDADSLASLLAGRPALLTPHILEFARLAGLSPEDVATRHFDAGLELAARLRATVLLKGVPTVISSPEGARLVSASGTPALATAGSGDVLAGIAATLLAQTKDALLAGGCAAWVHGRAAEVAGAGRTLRGITLGDVIDALALAWPQDDGRALAPPVLAELDAPVTGR